jgi:aminoglycoside phosphotransferase (APT) family kinase protein
VTPVAVEADDAWVGTPFLLMTRVGGRVVHADQPFLRTGWLAEADPAGQARLHACFVDLLAGIHRLDPGALACDSLPGATAPPGDVLTGEIERWARYLSWAADGAFPPVFADALAWCREHRPDPEPDPSVLWGDVQLGNVLVADDMTISAVLDFEMASIGPAEVDLAWFLVLHRMTVERCRGDLPGFPDRDGTIAAYEARLGRTVADMRWFEVFAALRSGAIMVRIAHLLARLGVDDSWLTKGNPTVALLGDLIAG